MKRFKKDNKKNILDETFKRQKTIKKLRQLKEEKRHAKLEMREYENSSYL